jgi:hypothetical protein
MASCNVHAPMSEAPVRHSVSSIPLAMHVGHCTKPVMQTSQGTARPPLPTVHSITAHRFILALVLPTPCLLRHTFYLKLHLHCLPAHEPRLSAFLAHRLFRPGHEEYKGTYCIFLTCCVKRKNFFLTKVPSGQTTLLAVLQVANTHTHTHTLPRTHPAQESTPQ